MLLLILKTHSKVPTPSLLLKPGDEILISSGTAIPCDCYVLTGSPVIDQVIITGEALPVQKQAGGLLLAGTKNLSAEFSAVVVREQEFSALQRLIDSTASATEQNPSDMGMVQRVTRVFVQAILALSLAIFALTYINFPAGYTHSKRMDAAVSAALPVLTVACPCSIGLAVPSVFMATLSKC